MKFKKLKLESSSIVVLITLCILGGSTISVIGQAWGSNNGYQSFTSQNEVKQPLDNYVDPGKNLVDGKLGDISITENTVGSSKDGGGAGQQSMYYYEMYPAGSGGHGQAQPHPLPQGQQGRQMCYNEQGVLTRCNQRTASFYPSSYEAAGSNNIASYGHRYTDNRQGQGQGWGMEEEVETGEGGGGGAIGGLAGLIGLLGLKGFKGLLPLLPILPFLPILLLLLPVIVIGALLLPLILLLFLPIPIVVTPGAQQGRSIASGLSEFSERAWRASRLLPDLAAEVLQSEECVERISCEVARVSRKMHLDGWIDGFTSSLPKENKYTKKIVDGVKNNKALVELNSETGRKTSDEKNGDCSVYSCKAKSILSKHMTKL